MEKNKFGERFILVSETKSYQEMGTLVRKKLGKLAPKIIPKFLLNFAHVLSILFGWLVPALRIVNKVNVESISNTTPISNKKITETLDFQFIPVSESVDFHFKNYISENIKS